MKNALLKGGLLLLTLGFGLTGFAQNPDNANLLGAQEEETPQYYEVYCELVSFTNGIFTNKVTVDIDFGQYTGFWTRDRALIDEAGNDIVFNSILDAANYLAQRGWVFKQAYVIQSSTKGDSGTPYQHWIMAKIVSSPEEIVEGLRTRGMAKR